MAEEVSNSSDIDKQAIGVNKIGSVFATTNIL